MRTGLFLIVAIVLILSSASRAGEEPLETKFRRLLVELDDPKFRVRERAAEEMARLPDEARLLIEKALANPATTPEVRQRLEMLSSMFAERARRRTEADQRRSALRAWYRRNTAGVYAAAPHPASHGAVAKRLFDAFIESRVGGWRRHEHLQSALEAAEEIERLEGADPLLQALAARVRLDMNAPSPEAAARAAAAHANLVNISAPAIWRAQTPLVAAVHLATSSEDLAAERVAEIRRLLRSASPALREVFADPDVPRQEIYAIFQWLGEASLRSVGDRRLLANPEYLMLEQVSRDEGLMMGVRGLFNLAYALDARETAERRKEGTLREISEELFIDRSYSAVQSLQEALSADPTDAHAAAALMRAAALVDADVIPADTFYQAIAARPDAIELYETRLEAVATSRAELLVLADACLRTSDWESGVPMVFIDAHLQIALLDAQQLQRPQDHTAYRAYFEANPGLWDELDPLLSNMLRVHPDSRELRARYAILAAWCGQWEIADAQLRQLGEKQVPGVRAYLEGGSFTSLREQIARHVAAPATRPADRK
jgi:hypothetical protein